MSEVPIVDEAGARAWVAALPGVSRETMALLDDFAAFVLAESAEQNLIAASTATAIWQRHIADSAQLLRFVTPDAHAHWLDLGTGAGFPGLVIALIAPCRVTLVESRALRIAYLERAVARFGLSDRVTVAGMPLARVAEMRVDMISARAFAPLPKIISGAARFSTEKTLWLLPKGRNGTNELESLAPAWQHVFHVEQSLTESDARILVGWGRADGPVTPPTRRSAPAQHRAGRHSR